MHQKLWFYCIKQIYSTLRNDFSWNDHVDNVLKECSKRLNGLYKIQNQLDLKQKKAVAEGAILSRIKYAIEVTSTGSETITKRLESMQSKTARYILGKSRREWSRSEGYRLLNWLTVPQTSVEFSLRMFFKVLWNRKPQRIFASIFDEDSMSVRKLTDEELRKMRKLTRKSWCVRVLRYADVVPQSFYAFDPNKQIFKKSLKNWVSQNIEKDGDFIFQGKLRPVRRDWLALEVAEWRRERYHKIESMHEQISIEDEE